MTSIQTEPRTAQTATLPADGRVLVTGGASGLGAAVVSALLERGATPIVVDRAEARVEGVAQRQADVGGECRCGRPRRPWLG